MTNIKESEIEKAIDDNKCPEPMFCTVATTCYEPYERERRCLKCWLRWCEDNVVAVDYD